MLHCHDSVPTAFILMQPCRKYIVLQIEDRYSIWAFCIADGHMYPTCIVILNHGGVIVGVLWTVMYAVTDGVEFVMQGKKCVSIASAPLALHSEAVIISPPQAFISQLVILTIIERISGIIHSTIKSSHGCVL